LRQFREHAGLGQERLAERAGMSVPTISNLERGVNRPRLETVNLLAEALALPGEQRATLLAAALRERTTAPSPSPPTMPTVAPRHNLPVPPNALVGLECEVATVLARLQDPALRLLTLTGVGGVGKTRVALAVGAALVAHYPDGVWLVELAPLADPAGVPSGVAGALGLREEPNRPLPTTLVQHLLYRKLLLVLDNCEHLLGASADLASTLLRSCPGVRILATSREMLGVNGEEVHPVPPLGVPDPHCLPPPELVGSYEAVRLFLARAQARRPEFSLEAHNAHAVVTICERLDGIPLALELAAARVGSLSVEAIAARLDERFGLLTLGPRDVPLRQRTLRATMDWSWDLLDEQEQRLLRRLAVFAGGWTLAAAEAVIGVGKGIEALVVLDVLDGLVNKSLVQVDPGNDGGRYRLLETVRQYAGERLTEAGEGSVLRERHLAWCVDLAQEAELELTGSQQARWLARLEQEHDNLRTALVWAREEGENVQGLRLAGALWRFWNRRGYLAEGRGWLDLAATLDYTTAVPAEIRAKALNGAGNLAYEQGDYRRAAVLHGEALALRRVLGDRVGIATSLNNLANVAAVLGDYRQAMVVHEEVLALRRELGDTVGIAMSLSNLGSLASLNKDYDRAAILHEEALALRRELGDRAGIANSLSNLGSVAALQGDFGRATTLLQEGLALRRAMADKPGMAESLYTLGWALAMQGEYEPAAALLEECLLLSQEIGAKNAATDSLEVLAWVAAGRGQPHWAAQLGGAAEAIRHILGIPVQPDWQASHEEAVQAMREALGEKVFAAAWAAGRALSFEEAIALALDNAWGQCVC
jgi:non-specific serine/threonine protein kinase